MCITADTEKPRNAVSVLTGAVHIYALDGQLSIKARCVYIKQGVQNNEGQYSRHPVHPVTRKIRTICCNLLQQHQLQ